MVIDALFHYSMQCSSSHIDLKLILEIAQVAASGGWGTYCSAWSPTTKAQRAAATNNGTSITIKNGKQTRRYANGNEKYVQQKKQNHLSVRKKTRQMQADVGESFTLNLPKCGMIHKTSRGQRYAFASYRAAAK